VADSRSTGRHLLAALGAILLAISVFLPWYGISFTAQGIAYTQQVGNQVASEFGNATLQSYMGAFHANVAGLGGHEFLSVSAHQALSNISVVLLILAGLSILIELFALAGPASAYAEANRAGLALVGLVAGALVIYRMLDRPDPSGGLLALSLREGVWIALLGALAMTAGALWPRRVARAGVSRDDLHGAWSELSGWTPEA
jgi:hypothetical protein